MKLYTYFRSSAAYRVRIALNLKGLAWEAVPVHLLRDGGEQLSENYRKIHPGALIPALETDGLVLHQSMAIIEYLDEVYPAPALMPSGSLPRARVRALAQAIACDIHPLNNLRVLRHLQSVFGVDEDAKNAWYVHWIEVGFRAIEAQLAGNPDTGIYCFGDSPTMADCCLVPQVFNARRFGIDMATYPTIERIDAACADIEGFAKALPSLHADAE